MPRFPLFLLGALLLWAAPKAAQADDPPASTPPATSPSPNTVGGLLGGVRPPVESLAQRAEHQLADELAEIAQAPGHEAAEGALLQAREALDRGKTRRLAGDTGGASRALGVARAALELAGRQAALARERSAAGAAGRARDLALARARAAREALAVAQRLRDQASRAAGGSP